MNALELADELNVASSEMEYNYVVNDWKLLSDSAEMLRQQHAKIKAYKERVAFLEAKCMIVDPINDKDYPFMKIMKGNKNED